MSLAAFLPAIPAQASGPTADPLLLAPTFIDQAFGTTVTAGTGTTTGISYTVPSGRIFRLQYSKALAQTGVTNNCSSSVIAGSTTLAISVTSTNTSPSFYAVDTVSGATDYPAGTVIVSHYSNSGAASCFISASLHGVEFNAP